MRKKGNKNIVSEVSNELSVIFVMVEWFRVVCRPITPR